MWQSWTPSGGFAVISDENSASTVAPALQLFTSLATEGITVILSHHLNKIEDKDNPLRNLTGSHAFAGEANTILFLHQELKEIQREIDRLLDLHASGMKIPDIADRLRFLHARRQELASVQIVNYEQLESSNRLAGAAGFEPTTFGFGDRRSAS